jgi:hypothetical protein
MWWLVACRAPDAPPIAVDPPSGPSSGYYPVSIELDGVDFAAADVTEVRVGPNRAYGLTPDHDRLVVTVQGAPDPGPQDVVLTVDGREHRFPGAFSYDPPLDPAFDRVFAMGASLTEGVQGGVPTQHGVLHDPAFLVARQMGAYLGLPVLVDPLFPPIAWSDLGPPPDCTVPDVVGHVASAAIDVLAVLAGDDGVVDFANARVDPELQPRNVAVGGSRLGDLVHGPPPDPTGLFVVKMVYAPDAGLGDPISTSQLDLAEQARPTLVLVADTFANDLVNAILTSSDGIDLAQLTPPDQLRVDLDELCARLSATGAEVFLANVPRPSLLPATAEKRAAWVAGGGDPAQFDADVAEVDAMGDTYDQVLAEVVVDYPQVHVVDFHARVAEVEETGITVAGHPLTVDTVGGLLGTDGVHFGDVGYGLLADLFVATISDTLGVDVPPVDLDALYADDPFSPDAARAAGVDPDACR